MGSLDKNVKEKQLKKAASELEAFKKSQQSQGVEEKTLQKNPKYRALKAALKKARSRISAIEAAEAHVAAIKEKDVKLKTEKTQKSSSKGQKKAAAGGKKKKK